MSGKIEHNLSEIFIDIFETIQSRDFSELPSEWAEKHRTLTSAVSTRQGKFKYNQVPYLKEVIDCLSPFHPAKVIAVMKGSQVGFTEGVIMNGIPWLIKHNPGNIIMTSASDDLSKELIEGRLDQAIQSTGIQHLIRPNVLRKRNQRTGDTSKYKEFSGGRLYVGGTNATNKLSRQRSIKYGFFDDWDAAPISDKVQGSLFDILQKRFSTAKNSMKQFYISTPETRPSNIEEVYLKGDQRKWHVPCPRCGDYIQLIWNDKNKDGEKIGILFDIDDKGTLIKNSVRYKCQKCGGEFKEKHKFAMNLKGKWIPTATPEREGYYSYHMTNLIAAPFMFGWTDFAYEWASAHADGNVRKSKLKVFFNQTLGLPWEEKKTELKASLLSGNTRGYSINLIPREQSIKDSNGDIILITCACDLNGTIDDARLDYEVVGHSENGSIYAINHGSIGTYQPKKKKDGRKLWTYRNKEKNNVWDFFYNEIINQDYAADDSTAMRIFMTGVDTGYYTHYANTFIDSCKGNVVGVKGASVTGDKYFKVGNNVRMFKPSADKSKNYILQVEALKDKLAERISLKWSNIEQPQPPGFLNFPTPAKGKYTVPGYFKQYEAEEKILETNEDGEVTGYKWTRKHSSMANHYFDVMVYNLAIRDIVADMIYREVKKRPGTWADFVDIMKGG
jgi:phage terminase large subunit GpA-like protein